MPTSRRRTTAQTVTIGGSSEYNLRRRDDGVYEIVRGTVVVFICGKDPDEALQALRTYRAQPKS